MFKLQVFFWRHWSSVNLPKLLYGVFHITKTIAIFATFCHFRKTICVSYYFFALFAKINARGIYIFAWLVKINVCEKPIFWSSQKLINIKVSQTRKYLVWDLFWDIAFEFGFENLQCQKMLYMKFLNDFSVFFMGGVFQQSHLFVGI